MLYDVFCLFYIGSFLIRLIPCINILYNMLAKTRSNSLTVAQRGDIRLQNHLSYLIEESQQLIRQRLQRVEVLQQRVQSVQKAFSQWAGKKQSELQVRLEKSAKNKQEHISKIVKKCKEHDKFLNQKLKNYHKKNRTNLREAWKKAKLLRDNTQKIKTQPTPKENIEQANVFMTESVVIDQPNYQQQDSKEYLHHTNQSKIYNNNSKEYWTQLNQSLNYNQSIYQNQNQITQYQQRLINLPQSSIESQNNKPQAVNNNMLVKLKQTLTRFRQKVQKAQQTKIQELGQHLQKIQQSRMKRLQIFAKKKQKRNATQDEYQQELHPPKNAKKLNKSQRVRSEGVVKVKRVRDWSQANKQKRKQEQLLQLRHGTEYLQTSKIKFTKTNLTKKVAFDAIEKKLYFQRLHH